VCHRISLKLTKAFDKFSALEARRVFNHRQVERRLGLHREAEVHRVVNKSLLIDDGRITPWILCRGLDQPIRHQTQERVQEQTLLLLVSRGGALPRPGIVLKFDVARYGLLPLPQHGPQHPPFFRRESLRCPAYRRSPTCRLVAPSSPVDWKTLPGLDVFLDIFRAET